MAPADLYLRAANRPFWANFLKGYISIWFQMVVVTCFGVAFSTFLSGPVAMLTTVAALVMGFFKGFVFDVASGEMPGGGPLESLVRLLTQRNQMVELEPGLGTTMIQLIDSVLLQVMQAVSYAMPDCGQVQHESFRCVRVRHSTGIDGTASGDHDGLRIGHRHRGILSSSRHEKLRHDFPNILYPQGHLRSHHRGAADSRCTRSAALRFAIHETRKGDYRKAAFWRDCGTRIDFRRPYLGEIDPASESMKLATLGMRGVAANLLWERANRYKREHDWDSLAATLNQISKLQPNFISVWQFQGWNLAYNVSIEFDDYRSRYQWVKRGIDFYREGFRYNTEEPVLDWEVGWTFGHKMGKADEYVQFRRLYRDDRDYHQDLSTDVNMDNTVGPGQSTGQLADGTTVVSESGTAGRSRRSDSRPTRRRHAVESNAERRRFCFTPTRRNG